MSEWAWILIAVLVIVVLGIVAWSLSRRRRSARLKEHFGPEYDRTVGELGEQRAAEAELAAREKKRKKLDIVELTPEARQEHAATWQMVQAEFVDAPSDAVGRAERLVTRVMRERGYPIDDFEQRAADISVEHPVVVQRYREARVIADANEAGRAGTEELRQAVTSYRALVVALLEPAPATDDESHDTRDAEPHEDRRQHLTDERHGDVPTTEPVADRADPVADRDHVAGHDHVADHDQTRKETRA
jgi:hypothetical protein